MRNIVCKNKKGISLVESIVSILLLSTAVIAIMSLQSTSWNTSSRSDYLGRAVMMLSKELTAREAFIMNPCNWVDPINTVTDNKTVYTSDQTTQQLGDASYNLVIVTSPVAGTTNTWRVTVTVSGPLRNARTVTDNLIVTRQEYFRSGCI